MKRSKHPLAIKSQTWIMEALLQLMKEKPYDQITVSEICQKAGVDRRTFYRNFKTKGDVLHYKIQKLKEAYLQELNDVEQRSIYTMAVAEFRFWYCQKEFLTVLNDNNILISLLLDSANVFVPQIYSLFHKEKPKDFSYKVAFLIGGYCNLINQWINNDTKETPEKLAQIINDMFDDNNSYWQAYIPKH